MIKLLVLFRPPEDRAAFFAHIERVHTPLLRRLPGLGRLVLDRITADASGAEPRYALVVELHFADRETFRAAMRSKENAAVAEDLRGFAAGLATVLISASTEDA